MSGKTALRNLPKIDIFMQKFELIPYIDSYGVQNVTEAVRWVLAEVRQELITDLRAEFNSENELLPLLQAYLVAQHRPVLRRVINATGIVLHTNLGRAPLSKAAMQAVHDVAHDYANLELDLDTGKRGSRYSHVLGLLQHLTGCEDALVVNNNAAAVMLALASISKGKEAIVSRGQLVEIGGAFRIPEVMEASGAVLREVGSTNKTHLRDYAKAISENTGLLLKVHTSNYRIVGFTDTPSTEALAQLATDHNIPLLEDLGSGFLLNLQKTGITDEPAVKDLIKLGVDVVTFSGDKLLGGPQAGIIVGKKALITKMNENPLTRALRVDKMTIAALEATLRAYLNPETVLDEIPTLAMLTISTSALRKKAFALKQAIIKAGFQGTVEVIPTSSLAGGGSLPTTELESFAVELRLANGKSLDAFTKKLRREEPALIGRVQADALLLDLRTIRKDEFSLVASLLVKE